MTLLTHPTTNPETGECADLSCPCHDYVRQEPLESISGCSEPSGEVKIDSSPSSASGINLPAPDFEREWEEAPAHLKSAFHPDLIRAAVFDVIDAGCNCGIQAGETGCHAPWALDDENEDFANDQRVAFADAVIARLREWRQISGEPDPSSEYFFLRGERSGALKQMIEENRVFRAMAEQRGLGR